MNGVFAENGAGLAFVGDFARVYRENADPWGQKAQSGPLAAYYHVSRRATAHALKAIGAHGDALEIGCGHGHAIKAYRMMGPMLAWQGADISTAAVDEAARLYPNISFRALDIAGECRAEPEFDALLWGECLWYLLENIDAAVANSHSLLREGGALVVSQGFLREQRYGRDIADGFSGTARMFQTRYPHLKLIHAHYDESEAMPLQHGVMAFRIAE